jgi:hypothetical protein
MIQAFPSNVAAPNNNDIRFEDNTSGQGKDALVPDSIKGFSWGALLLGWIWGIGNSIWIALIDLVWLVPGIGWIPSWILRIILGFKGKEMAWKAKKWDSIEHFNRTQKQWALAGFIAYGALALFAIIAAITNLFAAVGSVLAPIQTISEFLKLFNR